MTKWKLTVDNDGALHTATSPSTATVLEQQLQSPNGTNYVLTVSNDGALIVAAGAATPPVGYWTYARIQKKIREYTGLYTENQISTIELQQEIGWYMSTALPIELQPESARAYWVATITAGSELIKLPDSIISLSEPMTLDYGSPSSQYDPNYFFDPINEDDANQLYFNMLVVDTQPQNFFQTWPNNQTWAQAQPYAVLYYGREILFRPPPDQTYTFRSPALVKPTALANNLDLCPNDVWGQYIAYAVAHKLMSERGDLEREATMFKRKISAKNLCVEADLIADGDLMLRPVGRW